ncbi:metal-dependent transcriptional regulator [Trueperella bialowiezensis]|uniref:Iron-dependent repressor IdeR n=1 Tax=Trueperella bialowiezensis TaxID=312285 RepID=A0A3S4WG34_9ACTO|nr:metal-dependent transcriptional regulator [Trueperella bialowiezensis]VEI13088.1 Iron-dependent repressor IdeR [Trueperella bialowiezensis]
MSQLIDTTEMYLKTIYELYEEGVPALRARIVERLGQSGPTVSETVGRLERDGLVTMAPNRQIVLTETGKNAAIQVMRRHRLAERLLFDVIKLDWAAVHEEACRWEHVVSDVVADKIAELLDNPETDPFGNPIPAADATEIATVAQAGLVSVMDVSRVGDGTEYEIIRLAEIAQLHEDVLAMLDYEELRPGVNISVDAIDADSALVSREGYSVRLSAEVARGIFVNESQ